LGEQETRLKEFFFFDPENGGDMFLLNFGGGGAAQSGSREKFGTFSGNVFPVSGFWIIWKRTAMKCAQDI
jgi:hypothetical protein